MLQTSLCDETILEQASTEAKPVVVKAQPKHISRCLVVKAGGSSCCPNPFAEAAVHTVQAGPKLGRTFLRLVK